MSFFNFRRGSSSAPQPPGAGQPETMDAIRKRAKHRLIGAAVLVLIGVVGFPLLFDAQPRPVAVDIPIEIPGKNSVKPLTLPAKPDALSSAPNKPASLAVAAKPEKTEKTEKTDKVTAAASLGSQEEIVTDKKPEAQLKPAPAAIKKEAEKVAKAESATPSKLEPKPKLEPKAETKPETKPVAKVDDGARAKALLDGQSAAAPKPAAADAADQRLVVQVGAFADADKAKEVRQKLEKAGLKTYTQVAQTKDGERTRVRVGPFASKADAEKAASKIKSLDLPAAILTL